MKNITVLQLAEKVMIAHNEICGYETFKNINLNTKYERIDFIASFQFMRTAFDLTEMLNLTLNIGTRVKTGTTFQIT